MRRSRVATTAGAAIRLLRAGFATLGLVAIAAQLAVHVRLHFDVVNYFSYFTNLSNLIAVIALFRGASLAIADAGPGYVLLRTMSVIYMTVVGSVFSVLLHGADLGSLMPWVNFVLHYVMPCVVVSDWILLPPRRRLRATDLLRCLILPLTYLVYTLVRGRMLGWYPYPFLDPARVGSAGVAGFSLGIAAIFIFGGWLLIAVANWRSTPLGVRVAGQSRSAPGNAS